MEWKRKRILWKWWIEIWRRIFKWRKNWKGKEYNYDGKLIFEGEYLYGKRGNGKGKEYNIYTQLLYEGEYLNGERNGNGK